MCFGCCFSKEKQEYTPLVTKRHYSQDTDKKTNQVGSTVIHASSANTFSTTSINKEKLSSSMDSKQTMIEFARKGRQFLDQMQGMQAIACFEQALDLAAEIYGDQNPDVKYAQELREGVKTIMQSDPSNILASIVPAFALAAVLSNLKELTPVIGNGKELSDLVLKRAR